MTAVRTDGGVRTHVRGSGGGLVYVRWDLDGLVSGVFPRDLKLESEGEPRP